MKLLISAAVAGLTLVPMSVAAQALDGTWVGSTPRGSALSVTISGNQVTSYYFQNRPHGISGGVVSKTKASFNVGGPAKGQVTLTKGKGNTAAYRYTDNTGPEATTATLTRQ